jgi:hypothetical protein
VKIQLTELWMSLATHNFEFNQQTKEWTHYALKPTALGEDRQEQQAQLDESTYTIILLWLDVTVY